MNLPDKVGVTANLTLNYRAPTKADQVCLIVSYWFPCHLRLL